LLPIRDPERDVAQMHDRASISQGFDQLSGLRLISTLSKSDQTRNVGRRLIHTV
jgi:hypothetical protein